VERETAQETARKVRQFQALGGVPLGRLEEDEIVYVQAGTMPHKRAVFRFVCPLCGNKARNDADMEPMCTGPSWADEHEPTVMTRQPLHG
jgi:hypothetical protein